VTGRFHDAHEATYGYCYRDDPTQRIEWVNLRVSGIGPITRPTLAGAERGDGDTTGAQTGERAVWFGGAWQTAALYRRDGLRAGNEVTGPAVIEEFGSTVPVAPGFCARVDDLANLVIAARPVGSTT
jgi:N-methylhydantoinase A